MVEEEADHWRICWQGSIGQLLMYFVNDPTTNNIIPLIEYR